LQAATTHPPAEQAAAALGSEQVLPQAPQCAVLLSRLVSQPSAGLPLQLPKPGLQLATAQVPPAQAGVPLATAQALPQPPQFETLLSTLVSHPFAALLSQLA
jgi:hypothetical protein